MTDSGERTEQATQKRMKEVRQKGQLQHSKDLVAWVAVGAAAAMIPGLIASAKDTGAAAVLGFRDIIAHPDPEAAVAALRSGMGSIIPALTPMFVVVVIAVVAASAVQGGIHLKRPAPRFDQFEPVAGLKRIFGFQALWEGAKALLKTVVVGLVLFSVLQGLMPVLSVAGGLPISNLLAETTGSVVSVLQAAIIAGRAVPYRSKRSAMCRAVAYRRPCRCSRSVTASEVAASELTASEAAEVWESSESA